MYWLQISFLFIISPKKKSDRWTGEVKCSLCSQPPNIALALSTSWKQLVLVAADRLAATLPGAMERAQTGCAELETTVVSAADPLSLHGVTPRRMLAARARLQALVTEERFGNLKGDIKEILRNRPRLTCTSISLELQLTSINLSRLLLLPECCKGVKVLFSDWGVQKMKLRDWA